MTGVLALSFQVAMAATPPKLTFSPTYCEARFVASLESSAPFILISEDGGQIAGLWEAGLLRTANITYTNRSLSGMTAWDTLLDVGDLCSGVAEASGRLSGDFTKSEFFISSPNGGVRYYPSVTSDWSDPLAQCFPTNPSVCSSGDLRVAAVPEEEDIGSLVVTCGRVGLFCDPVTVESSSFAFLDSVTHLAVCPDCNPAQMFLLTARSNGFTIESVATDLLLQPQGEIAEVDRIALFTVEGLTGEEASSLAVIRDPSNNSQFWVYVSAPPLLHQFSLALTPQVGDSLQRSSVLAIVVLVLLLVGAVVAPLLILLHPRLRAKMDDWRWMRDRQRLGLDEDSEVFVVPRRLGHRHPSIIPEDT